ncbi:MAG: PAS domain-containing protein [Chloroflexia bacterium]|nr:PAS domain-containing protein [Chloroflexia bacterium]
MDGASCTQSTVQPLQDLRRLLQRTAAQESLPADLQGEFSAALDRLRDAVEEQGRKHEALLLSLRSKEAECQHYRDLFESTPHGYLLTDGVGTILQANRAARELLAAGQPALRGRPLSDFVPTARRPELRQFLLQAQRAEGVLGCSLRLQPQEGPPFEAGLVASCSADGSGRPASLHILFRNITARKHVEDERERLLQWAENLYQESQLAHQLLDALIDTMPVGVILCDGQGQIIRTNEAAVAILGEQVGGTVEEPRRSYTPLHLDGRSFPVRDMPLWRALERGDLVQGQEILIRRPDGSERIILAAAAPIRDGAGEIVRAATVFQDISEQRHMLQTLRRQTRDLELLNRLGQDMGASLDISHVLERMLAAAQEVIPCEGSSLWLRHAERERELVCRAAIYPQRTRSPQGLCLEWGQGVVGWVAEQGETVLLGAPESPCCPCPATDEETGLEMHSLLAVPLWAGGRVIGVLKLVNKKGGGFDRGDRSLIETLAGALAVAVENAQLYEQAQLAAAAAERSRLANELHDAVSQTLFSASVIAESLPRLWERNPERVHWGLDQLQKLTRGALAEMRTLLLELRPQVLEEGGLPDLLRQLTDAAGSRSRVDISLSVRGRRVLPLEVKIAFYRITQEGINNLIKHAQARRAWIRLHLRPSGASLRIRDDGRGFDADDIPADRLGLRIIRERAEAIGAAVEISSQPDQGTEIFLGWPDPQWEGRDAAAE